MAVSVEAAAEEASSLVLCDTEAEPPATTFRWALNTSTGLTNLGPRRSDIISHLIFFDETYFLSISPSCRSAALSLTKHKIR